MAYGDYIDAATLQDTCDALATVTPGKNAGCKFLGQAEEATTAAANRPHLALAENMDNIKLPLDSDIAITQVGVLSGFAGTDIIIDPAGGAHSLAVAFSPVGSVYMGNNTDYTGTPENFDTLFQILDENYDEVMIDGVEVKVASVFSGAAVGTGFTAAAVTLRLNKTLPTGNYRFSYARDATLATLPDDALIRADIRGLQEGAAESGKIGYAICDAGATSPARPADYFGVTALSDAITAGEKRIYLRAGAYGPTNTLTLAGVHVVGEDQASTTVEVDTSSTNGRIELNNGSSLEDLTLDPQSGITSTAATIVMSSNSYLRRVTAVGWGIQTSQRNIIEDVTSGGSSSIIAMSSDFLVTVRNLRYDAQYITTGTLFSFAACSEVVFENVRPLTPGSGLTAFPCLSFLGGKSSRLSFTNCYFETGAATGLTITGALEDVKFANCELRGSLSLIDANYPPEQLGVVLENCRVINTATGWYDVFFVEIYGQREPEGTAVIPTAAVNSGFMLNNVFFQDARSKGTDDASDPPTAAAGGGTPFPVMRLQGVTGRNVIFDRVDCPYLIMDESWVRLTKCNINGFAVHHYDTPNGMDPFSYGAYADGLIEIDGQSRITDISAQLNIYFSVRAIKVAYAYGIISVLGGDYTQATYPYAPEGRTIVEGVDVRLAGTALLEDDTPGPVCGVLAVRTQSTVRGFSFGNASEIMTGGVQSKAIVVLDGKDVVFEDFNIVLDNDSGGVDVETAILCRETVDSESHTIRNGRIYISPATGFRPLNAILLHDYVVHVLIDNVTVIWDGDIQSGDNHIFDLQGTSAALVSVLNCTIRINGDILDTTGGSANEYGVIRFNAASAGGGFGNTGVAIGNRVVSADGNNPVVPVILPNVIGITAALNHLDVVNAPTMTK